MSRRREPPPIKITAALRQRFRRCAPAALARRNTAYLVSTGVNVGQWLLIGSLGLFGLHHWQWTASHMLLVFVAGIVSSILADSVRWVFAQSQVAAEYRAMEDDRLVWAMLDADNSKAEHISTHRLQARHPAQALLLDIVFGAAALWVLSAQYGVFGLGHEGWSSLGTSVQLTVGIVLGFPVLSMVVSALARRRTQGGYDELEFRAGGRGIGMLMLAAVLALSGDNASAARNVMQFVHWAMLVSGVMALVGVAIMVREREQLRERLTGQAVPTERSTEPPQRVATRRRRR